MALKKSQLYSSLWQSCDELRGGMDASQYKDYVLTLLFMKYVSDKYAGKPNALIEVPKGGGFADMVALGGDKEIGDKINKIIGKLAEANDLKGVIDQADFNDEGKLGAGKEMQDRLSKLVAIFDGLDFRANRAEGDDLLGDAYEYLMRHFATESGKSKGQFYTPAEVSRIMAQVIGLDRAAAMDQPTVYDPTCGSGSLLIKAADQAAATKLAIYGQEMDVATWALARMNMILHGHPTAEIWRGQHARGTAFQEQGRQPQDVRLCGRESAVLVQGMVERSRSGGRRLRAVRARRAASEERRLRLSAALDQIAEEQGQGRDHPAARRVVPRQQGSRHPPESREPRPDQRDHRPAGEPLLRHRHPGLHRCDRQGERACADWHFHDRREQGLPQGREQEPAACTGHPPDRGRVQPADRAAALLAHGTGRRRSRTRPTITTSTSRGTSTPASPRTCTTWTRT